MTQIKIKRIYEDPEKEDGYRVLVDRLWPRGMKKECLSYDEWNKDLAPSLGLRRWFHGDIAGHWDEFKKMYREELDQSETVKTFLSKIQAKPVVTLLYASKEPEHNHARILQEKLKAKGELK